MPFSHPLNLEGKTKTFSHPTPSRKLGGKMSVGALSMPLYSLPRHKNLPICKVPLLVFCDTFWFFFSSFSPF